MKLFKLMLLLLPFVVFMAGNMDTPRWQALRVQASEDGSPAAEQSSASGVPSEEPPSEAPSDEDGTSSSRSVLYCILFVILAVCFLALCF